MLITIISISFTLLYLVSLWLIFNKAGEKGWHSIIPVYNFVIFLKIGNLNWYWVFLFFIPFINVLFSFYVWYRIFVSFGKKVDDLFTFLIEITLLSFIVIPILAFDSNSHYEPNKLKTV